MRLRLFVLLLCATLGTPLANLISKGAGILLAVDQELWAFDENNIGFSRVDLFSDPPVVTQRKRSGPPLLVAAAGPDFVIGVFETVLNDSIRETGLVLLRGDEESELIRFRLRHQTELEREIGFSSILANDSAVVILFGAGGAAVLPTSCCSGTNSKLDFLSFTLLSDSGTLAGPVCRGGADSACDVSMVSRAETSGPGVVAADDAVLDRAPADSLWLWVSAGRASPGLRRYLFTDSLRFAGPVALAELRIQRVFLHPGRGTLWAFTDTSIQISRDTGRTFEAVDSLPASVQRSLRWPRMAFFGDTAVVNLDLSGASGLVFFVGKTPLQDTTLALDEAERYLTSALSLPPDVKVGELAVVHGTQGEILAVGTSSRGIYSLRAGDATFANLSRRREVGSSLTEIITFPTVFDGLEPVGIGYQLKKSSRVTIEVFDYEMARVRTLVRSGSRQGGGVRSENPDEDRWDGRNDQGRPVSAGVYYVRVRAGDGTQGWGKILVVGEAP